MFAVEGRPAQEGLGLVEAETIFLRALAVEPKNATAYRNLAVTKERRRDIPGAIATLREARDAIPTDAGIRATLGLHLYGRGDRKAAREHFAAVVRPPGEPD